jgi:hypothetical protein
MAFANVRERLALHFDAEGSLQARVNEASYEVHIRMPYRPAGARAQAAANGASPGSAVPPAARTGRERAAPVAPGAAKPEAAHE